MYIVTNDFSKDFGSQSICSNYIIADIKINNCVIIIVYMFNWLPLYYDVLSMTSGLPSSYIFILHNVLH